MDSEALLKGSLPRRWVRVKASTIVGFLKAATFVVILAGCIGSLTFVVNTNQVLQAQIKRIIKKNSLLSHRVKRDLVAMNRLTLTAEENVEIVAKEKAKRSAADAPSEGEDLLMITSLNEGGVTYERWGRRDCSGPNNRLVSQGIAAGSWYSHSGGASNHLCLDMNVTYTPGRYVDGSNANAYLHGMEYRDSSWINQLLDLSLTEGTLQYHLVPCAICMARSRISKVMLPGRETCPDGWSLEYTGYIMSGGYNDKHSSSAICVDDQPQVVPGTQGNQHGAYLHMVEVRCESLLCEPFVHFREIRCVICTL